MAGLALTGSARAPTAQPADDRFSPSASHLYFAAAKPPAFTRVAAGPATTAQRPEDFGAVGDGRTDDTAAISSACRTGRNLVFTKIYLVRAPVQLCTFENADGVTLTFLKGSAIKFDPTQPWTPGASWAVFRFTNVTNVSILGNATFIGNLKTEAFSRGTYDGPIGFYFVGRARDIHIEQVTARNIGQPLQFDRRPSLKAAYVATIGAGGSGYRVGNVLTVLGGSPADATRIRVTRVDPHGGLLSAVVDKPGLYPGGDSMTVPTVLPGDDGVALSGNAGVGARLNIQWADADERTLAENVLVEKLDVDTVWYGFSLVYQGRGITVRQLVADNVYRAVIAYGGLENVEINVVYRNHYGDALSLASGHGLGMKNTRFNVRVLPQTALGGHNASKIRLGWQNSHPAIFSNVHFDVDCDYGTAPNRGGSLVEIDKEDDKGRGRVFSGLLVTGKITGRQDEDSGLGGNVIGTNLSRTWTTPTDTWKSIIVGPLEMRPAGSIVFDASIPVAIRARAN